LDRIALNIHVLKLAQLSRKTYIEIRALGEPGPNEKQPGRHRDRAVCKSGTSPGTHYLLLLEERFSPCWLLRLLLAPPRLALARPSERAPELWDLLPLLPLLSLEALPRPEDDEDLELRVAMKISLSSWMRSRATCAWPQGRL
jgi:hypothetical protein